MNTPDFVKTRKYLDDISTKELERKGPDYSPDSDRLGNFKEVAAFLGVSPKIVWGVYMLKHLFALRKWAQGGTLTSEGLEGRFVDLRNYIDLGYAISAEEIHIKIDVPEININNAKAIFQPEDDENLCRAHTLVNQGYETMPLHRKYFGPGKSSYHETIAALGKPVANALFGIRENENPRDRSRPTPNRVRNNQRKQKGRKRRGK